MVVKVDAEGPLIAFPGAVSDVAMSSQKGKKKQSVFLPPMTFDLLTLQLFSGWCAVSTCQEKYIALQQTVSLRRAHSGISILS